MAADYRRGFEDLRQEIHRPTLPTTGDLPGWLTGTLIRNGPAQFEVGDQAYNHWFDGHAMLHAFKIGGGSVAYRNRFLESQSRTEALAQGEIVRSEFATDPCMSIFGRVMSLFRPNHPTPTDNASINVARLGDAHMALTATPLPIAFDPDTLETAGVVEYDDEVGADTSTAHPYVEPASGRTLTQMLSFGRQSQYIVGYIDPEGPAREPIARLDVDKPSYMHSFGMTERHVILSEWPLVVDPLSLLAQGKPFIRNFEWEPERGVRFHVLRKRDGSTVATCRAEAAFAFHHVNAFEQDGEILCDVVAHPDASVIEDYFLDRLRGPEPTSGTGHLRRYRLPLEGGPATPERLSEEPLELPRIHEAQARAQSYDYVYGIGERRPGQFSDQLVKIDVKAGTANTWREDGTCPGEPVFVPSPSATSEDEGVVLSVVLDPEAERSFLLVLDAESFAERARAEVPHAIPHGFHGQFFQ
jgi:carotenoid cleavage dioxygenase-like enzyme